MGAKDSPRAPPRAPGGVVPTNSTQPEQAHLQEGAISEADGDERDLPVGTKLCMVGVGVRQAGRSGRAVDAYLRRDARGHRDDILLAH